MVTARLSSVSFVLIGVCATAWGQQPPVAPSSIAPDVVRQVKQATVLIKVTREDGRDAEGSGFFVIRSGIVVTNAHVLGMLRANSKPPAKIEAIVNSGVAGEQRLAAALAGVDRSNDLAVLKVEGTLPAPLQLASTDDLVETQKVYVFGFPFGSELGRNVTVSDSAISSLRSSASGELEQVQVNGGMHPGNSGGPVVDTQGRVVGVAVAVIRGTQINFAIPAGTVKSVLAGRILEAVAGEVFKDGATAKLPLQLKCIDPFQRIREVKVEVWAGNPTEKRDYSPKQAQTQPGDGPRQSQILKYQSDGAAADISLPVLKPGQVAWVQPVVSFTSGSPVWSAPQSFETASALQRTPADLTAKLLEQKERTVHLKTGQSVTITKGKNKLVLAQKAELDLLEAFTLDPKGGTIAIGFGTPSLTVEEDGKTAKVSADVAKTLQRLPPRFVVDETNRLRERTDRNPDSRLPPVVRAETTDYLSLICNGYEASNFVIPNRNMQPRETWPVKMPLLLKTGTKPEFVDLTITCMFEGIRTKSRVAEAFVTFDGKVQGRGADKDNFDGRVVGKFTVNLERGFISWVKMSVSSEASSAGGETNVIFSFDTELTRNVGNTAEITLPSPAPAAPSVAASSARPPIAKPGSNMRKSPSNPSVVERNEATGDYPFKGLFAKPSTSPSPTSYMKVVSDKGDYIGGGKTYEYTGDQLKVQATRRGVAITVEGWRLNVGAPKDSFIKEGEYPDAKRFAFSGDSPGLDFSGNGRGSNKLTGAFAVWELEIKGDKIVKLAIDFEQHSEGNSAGLKGKVRLNSTLE